MNVVRLALLLLALAGGCGVAVYAVLWLVLPITDAPAPEVRTHRLDDAAALVALAGALLVLRSWGVWFSDQVTIIGGVAAVGVVLVWGRAESADDLVRDRRATLRIAVGVVLVLIGVRRLQRPHRRRGRRWAAAPSAR